MRESVLKLIKEGDICAEVGVWKGDFAQCILNQKPSQLHLIDPWIHQDYIDRYYSIDQEKINTIYNDVVVRFRQQTNVVIHKAFSTAVDFEEDFFDFVYIDGNHNYENVKKDLEHYYPLVKKGGYICGDDYWLWHTIPKDGFGSDSGGGPKKAVDEFAKKHNLKIKTIFNQFIIHV